MPLVNLLVAVRCAEIRGNRERGLQLIEKYGSHVDDDYYLALARADILGRLGNTEESWTILDGLQEEHKRDPALLERLITAAIDRQELTQAQQWLGSLRKSVEQDRWLPLQHAIASAKMQEIASSDSDQKDTLLETYWLSLSRKTREDWPTFTVYLQALVDVDAHGLSEKSLREWVQKHWAEPAILAYGSLTTDTPEKLKKTAAGWLRTHPDDWALNLTLGRLAVKCEDFEEAKSYFIKSLELKPNEAAYLELAQLLHQLDEFSASQDAYQKAIACRAQTTNLVPSVAQVPVAAAAH
jgi:HemY protein